MRRPASPSASPSSQVCWHRPVSRFCSCLPSSPSCSGSRNGAPAARPNRHRKPSPRPRRDDASGAPEPKVPDSSTARGLGVIAGRPLAPAPHTGVALNDIHDRSGLGVGVSPAADPTCAAMAARPLEQVRLLRARAVPQETNTFTGLDGPD
ncbi:hypothetical protein CHELA40_11470 [Chelatococcus asaccharovorans]|nr:hypothetical protein CHELA40_11470 [Chelatococcus asaccharovorans]CAH1684703.1 hypothetical protein CHELA17_64132 [Chelatococcus asaccharovorans]